MNNYCISCNQNSNEWPEPCWTDNHCLMQKYAIVENWKFDRFNTFYGHDDGLSGIVYNLPHNWVAA